MNKQLILKYKAEFDHWLNGGKLSYFTGQEWLNYSNGDIWSGKLDLKIVINDEYVEFRKALAEGKTIQIFDVISQHPTNPLYDVYDWKDFKSFKPDSPFTYSVGKYRIKPEEPQFKVGDFVRDIISGKVSQVKNEDIVNGVYSKVIKWEPQAGELCWFADYKEESRAVLELFENTNFDGRFCSEYSVWKYCEPFLNSKPSWFKD